MTMKEIADTWRVHSQYVPHTYRKPSSILKAALRDINIHRSMCRAVSGVSAYTGLSFFQHTGLIIRAAYLRYHWTCLEVWRRWWRNDPYWDDKSNEAAERRIAFINHLIKKLEKHGL